MQINEREILRKLKATDAFIPPLEMADQQALLFQYRSALHVILMLLERLKEKDELIRLKDKGNSDLTKLLEDWIIKNPKVKKQQKAML